MEEVVSGKAVESLGGYSRMLDTSGIELAPPTRLLDLVVSLAQLFRGAALCSAARPGTMWRKIGIEGIRG